LLVVNESVGYRLVTAQPNTSWRETGPLRVIIRSTSDWARILFDDLNGTNTNGMKIASVLTSGWFTARNPEYTLDAGSKIWWQDQVFNQTVIRRGDQVEFFKGLRNFQYSEAYADLLLDVNLSMPQVYVWLMSGGNGTSSFEISNLNTGGTIWRDVIVGNGVTQQVRRVMSPQPFFGTAQSGDLVVVSWLTGVVVIVIALNFPIPELISRKIKARHSRAKKPEEQS
jgi:hypothetical protein